MGKIRMRAICREGELIGIVKTFLINQLRILMSLADSPAFVATWRAASFERVLQRVHF